MKRIHKQLQGLYPEEEIRSLTIRVLEHVCRVNRHVLLRDKDRILSLQEQVQIESIVTE